MCNENKVVIDGARCVHIQRRGQFTFGGVSGREAEDERLERGVKGGGGDAAGDAGVG